jgi:cell division transport system permease protein
MPRNRPNYLPVILSVALVLLVMGFFAMTAAYGNRFVALLKEKVEIWLELQPDLPEQEVARIVGTVRAQPFVKKETLSFITREQAAATIRKDLGDDALLADLPMLMHDVVRFNVKAEFLQGDSLAEWRTMMKADSAVADLQFEALSAGNAEQNLRTITWFMLGFALLLVLGAAVLIHNTIRLALYANRFIIKNQELVGASWQFIAQPYVRRGLINGLFSGALAVAALVGMVSLTLRMMPDFETIHDPNMLIAISIGIIALGGLIGGLSSRLVVNKFLRMKLEDLY